MHMHPSEKKQDESDAFSCADAIGTMIPSDNEADASDEALIPPMLTKNAIGFK